MHAHVYRHTCVHTVACMHVISHARALCACTHIDTCTRIQTCTRVGTCMHTHAHRRARTHTCVHAGSVPALPRTVSTGGFCKTPAIGLALKREMSQQRIRAQRGLRRQLTSRLHQNVFWTLTFLGGKTDLSMSPSFDLTLGPENVPFSCLIWKAAVSCFIPSARSKPLWSLI